MELKFEDLPDAIAQLIEQNNLILKSIQEASFSKRDNEEILTLSRICELLELKRQTIYSYVSKKQIPYHKKGGKLYFFKKEIADWIETENKVRLADGIRFNAKRKFENRKFKKL
ncbi:MAG: helix-turn-helix domain-containing protein [Bacteroidetes bacterium]|nr:helix-turn-helix domain-containing protein [Bacteroidota bacterium]